MLLDPEVGPMMQLCVESSRREKGWKKGNDKTCSGHSEPEDRKSQIKWELQQYPTYPELLENRSSKLMHFLNN